GGAVPVVLSVGSWDPTVPLRTWLAERLARDYPGLQRWGLDQATSLVEAGLVLPILDGFDEIAKQRRPGAVAALNTVARPLVVTSRVDEYAAAVAATGVLAGAPVVRLD